MAPRAAPDDDGDNTSETRVQPPYGATHPPNLFHHEVEGMPIWGIVVIVALIILLLALISYIVSAPISCVCIFTFNIYTFNLAPFLELAEGGTTMILSVAGINLQL
jgi:hypothetical protein